MTPPGRAHSRRELFLRVRDALRVGPTAVSRAAPAALLRQFLRPPGAAAEARFLALCERCDDCATACPHHTIVPLGPAYGPAAGTPAILPRDVPCHLCQDLPCAAACPTGALTVVAPSDVRMGEASLEADRCWAVMGQPCDYCVKECPVGPEALRLVGRRPEIGEACVGCGKCVHICAATPPALRVEPPQTQSVRARAARA